MSKQYLLITADTNDGDCISDFREITNKQLEKIKPVIKAIKSFKPYKAVTKRYGTEWLHKHNYPTLECHRGDLGEKSAEELYGHLKNFELFDDFVPYGEHGIHTIESIKIIEIKEELL